MNSNGRSFQEIYDSGSNKIFGDANYLIKLVDSIYKHKERKCNNKISTYSASWNTDSTIKN